MFVCLFGVSGDADGGLNGFALFLLLVWHMAAYFGQQFHALKLSVKYTVSLYHDQHALKTFIPWHEVHWLG